MSARPWIAEVKSAMHPDWQPSGLFLAFETAEAGAERVREHWRADLRPFSYRLLNRDTAEIIHLDAQGQPIPAEPVHHGRTRSVEDEMADVMGDRFEAARDPEWGATNA